MARKQSIKTCSAGLECIEREAPSSRAAREVNKILRKYPDTEERKRKLDILQKEFGMLLKNFEVRRVWAARKLTSNAIIERAPECLLGFAWNRKDDARFANLSDEKKAILLTKDSLDFDYWREASRELRTAIKAFDLPFAEDGMKWQKRMQDARDEKDLPAKRVERLHEAQAAADQRRKNARQISFSKSYLIRKIFQDTGIPQSTLKDWVKRGCLHLSLHSTSKS